MKEDGANSTIRFSGLTDVAVTESREQHGENMMLPPVREPWWKQFLSKFDDPVIRILIIAALISILTGEWVESIGIVVAILLSTVLTFVNEYKAAKEFDILNKVNDDVPVKVIRNAQFQMIPKRDVVVGDILFLELGEEVPADAQVLEAVNFRLDQSRLTGESDPVRKVSRAEAESHPAGEETYPAYMLLRGTPVVDGHGYAEVVAVGSHTEIGKTAASAAEEVSDKTPLTLQLEQLGNLIAVVGFSIAGFIFLALTANGYFRGTLVQNLSQWVISGILFIAVLTAMSRVWLPVVYDGLSLLHREIRTPTWLKHQRHSHWIATIALGLSIAVAGLGILYLCGALPETVSAWIAPDALPQFISFFMIAVALIVMAVPEGLPMSVTLSLAYSMRRMTAANNLVRKMHACETVGAVTVICTDKTGTLTMNQMRVRETAFLSDEMLLVYESIAVNSTANLSLVDPTSPQVIGNPTEGALLLWLREQSVNYEKLRADFKIVTQWTFSTERKFMATKGLLSNGESILYAKGAPEILLERCARFITAEGIRELNDADRVELQKQLLTFQARGMRTLGFAYLNDPSEAEDVLEVATAMVWMGFVAIADPVRPDVPDAIAACRKAGIQVKMVTGDNPETAREIGRQIHLWEDTESSRYQIMTGVEFDALDDAEALVAVEELKIMARARPNDKLRLVRCLKQLGEVVAVTGDGTNDAPALNYADVGIAMGKTGTSIAKEASDIILLDDSFASIVNAVMWGRSLYRNIQKFILFQLTVNVVALTIAMSGPFIGIDLPLTVIQVLWINLIMDTFAALALATDSPNPAVMDLPPRKNTAFIVTRPMWGGIFGVAIVFLIVLAILLAYMNYHELDSDLRWLTIFFSVFAMMQLWNLFNAKCWGTTDSIFTQLANNKVFLGIAVFIFAAQILIVQFGAEVFRVTPLGWFDWTLVIGGTSFILWGGEIIRAIRRWRK